MTCAGDISPSILPGPGFLRKTWRPLIDGARIAPFYL
jgi:hypothetical protein